MAVLVSLTGTSWVAPHNTHQTIEFKTSQVSGNAGCNRFFGTYKQTENTLKINSLATTRMACQPDVMKHELQFLTTLNKTSTVEVTDATLTLKDAKGAVLTVLARKNVG
ncbi:MAG: META domain-containing protein [Alphaproteobacteria bacterium]|nr:META domain-containing protein [Alphaproteobacteria bacterium]